MSTPVSVTNPIRGSFSSSEGLRQHLPDGLVHPAHPVHHGSNLSASAASRLGMRRRLLAAAAVLAASIATGAALATHHGSSVRFEVLGHATPTGGGYSGDVVLHRRHAYLSSHKGKTAARRRASASSTSPLPARRSGSRRSAASRRRGRRRRSSSRSRRPPSPGDLAVTSVQGCTPSAFRGFALYDVTHPGRPRELARVHTDPRGSHEIWLQPVGRRAYVYTANIASEILSSPDGQTPGKADFRIFDVTDPRRPVQVGGWGAWQELGLRPFESPNDRLNGNFVHSVIGDGRLAYLSYWDLGTVVLDVSDPAAPRYLGRTRGETDEHAFGVARPQGSARRDARRARRRPGVLPTDRPRPRARRPLRASQRGA